MHLSIAIQTHPARADLAANLATHLPGCELAVDPGAESGFPSPWRGYRNALETTPADATHRLVIQDDVIVCAGFPEAAAAAVAARPDRPVAFFVGGQPADYAAAVRGAAYDDVPWAVLDASRWMPVVALSWPVPLIAPVLSWVDEQGWPSNFTADDEIVGRAFRALKIRALATAPSLVEHPDNVPSLARPRRQVWAGRDPGRVAACYIADCDPAGIDWSLGPA